MICPYNGFKTCDWEKCAARMYVKDISQNYMLMKVCAIAYNGGNVPNIIVKQEEGEQNEQN